MITLHLYGELAEKFGTSIALDAKTPREAVAALSYQSTDYKEHVRTNDWHVFVGEGNDISEKELDLVLGKVRDVHLIPVIEGANSGAAQIIAGIVLVVVGVFTSWTGVGAGLIGAGVGLIVGGIITLLTKPDENKAAKDNNSFLFKGPSNSSDQGVAIPRGYGRCLVGSNVISAAVYAEEYVKVWKVPNPVTEYREHRINGSRLAAVNVYPIADNEDEVGFEAVRGGVVDEFGVLVGGSSVDTSKGYVRFTSSYGSRIVTLHMRTVSPGGASAWFTKGVFVPAPYGGK